mmetsp:Transcript_100981/g.174452  ORF Transcript_100981/g.174452 Transcript_100981/m.174452 type:complete len:92 (+) Transcript_100981:1186-1461(+)
MILGMLVLWLEGSMSSLLQSAFCCPTLLLPQRLSLANLSGHGQALKGSPAAPHQRQKSEGASAGRKSGLELPLMATLLLLSPALMTLPSPI